MKTQNSCVLSLVTLSVLKEVRDWTKWSLETHTGLLELADREQRKVGWLQRKGEYEEGMAEK